MPLSVRSSAFTFLAFAMPASMFGVMWPDVRDRFDQSLGALGVVSLVYGVTRMSTSGLGRSTSARLGTGPAFVAVLIGLAVVDLVAAAAGSWAMFLVGVGAIGIASGLLDSLGAGVLATLGDVGSAGIVHGAYGVGATVGPLAVALVDDWRWSLVVAAVTAVGALAVAVYARGSWPDRATAADESTVETAAMETASIDPAAGDPARNGPTSAGGPGTAGAGSPPIAATAVSLVMFFAFVATEVLLGNWLFTYLTEARSISESVAAVGVAGFWGGTTVGRLALVSPRLRDAADRWGLPAFALAAVGALALTLVAPGATIVLTSSLIGLALAPIVPTMTARTAERVGIAHAQRVSGWQLLAANVGAIGIPSLTGVAVDASSAAAVVPMSLAVFVIGVPSLVVARRLP